MDMQRADRHRHRRRLRDRQATAFLLAREGARVFIGDIDEAGGRSAAAEGAAIVSDVGFISNRAAPLPRR